jgi:DNA invertase Pin-like site-specific DNA recombinase
MARRVGLYARVSTGDQTVANQIRELRQVASRKGWKVVEEFIDHGISGAKGRDKRPAFDKMLRAAVRGEIDGIACWSVDRLGRSLQHLVEFLNEIHAAGTDLYLHQQAVDTATPGGKALFQMLGVFAEFERAMIAERVRAGIARARAAGRRFGRKTVIDDDLTKRVLALRRKGLGIHQIRVQAGCGCGTVVKILKAVPAVDVKGESKIPGRNARQLRHMANKESSESR